MPAVSRGAKDLYLSTNLGDLNKKAEVKPDKINTRSYVQSACKIFKAAEECRLDGDEEKAYVLYMKYLTVYDLIKKRPDFKQQQMNKTWEEALDHCRKHYTDLTSLLFENEQLLVQRMRDSKGAQTDHVWTGLRFFSGFCLWVNRDPWRTRPGLGGGWLRLPHPTPPLWDTGQRGRALGNQGL